MSYNQNYEQSGQQGYGQYNPYGQANPYDQRGNDYSQGGYNAATQPYGQAPYNQQASNNPQRPQIQQQSSSTYDEERGQGGYEMGAMGNRGGDDPNRILNDIRLIDREIDTTEAEVQRLQGLHNRFLEDPSASRDSPLAKEVDSVTDNVMQTYRALVARVKSIKQNPASGNPRNAPQVGKVDRRLRAALNKVQQVDRDYRQKQQEQIARQYRIVRPDASEQEVREAVEDLNNQQVFSQALISSNRRGEATRVAQSVRNRHEAIQKIERDMMELAQLFNDLEAAVIQQEDQVANIEVKADEVTQHVQKANLELTGAVDKAKAARRKKWICLGICVLIVIIIVIIVVLVIKLR